MAQGAIDPRVIARSSPAGLAWYASGGAWILAPHLQLLSQRIVDVATGRCPRLIVTMPPRHGKSELISKYTPAWFLGNYPDRKVMLTSYADTFAADWGRMARGILEELGPSVFGVRVNQMAAGGQRWEVVPPRDRKGVSPGVMVTAGVGGGLTGKGADLLIIDDPIKNSEEAQSERTRDAQHDWWKSTARTRLQRGAGVILVMTRWHEDDLAGRLLGDALEGGDQWEVLNLPAVCERDGDELGRRVGEPLWPEMFDSDFMERTRAAQGNYWFSAMYQQRPAPADGMLFRRENLRYFDWEDRDAGLVRVHGDSGSRIFDIHYGTVFQTVDVAGTSKEASDFTVCSTWCVTTDRDLLWLDCARVKFDSLDVAGFVRRQIQQWSPLLCCIERLGFGLTVIQELLREGLPIVRLEPDKDKVARALPAVARTEEGRVFLPSRAEWRDDVEAQLLAFPNAAHDDIVDTLSYAALQLPTMQAAPRFGDGGYQRSAGRTLTGGLLKAAL